MEEEKKPSIRDMAFSLTESIKGSIENFAKTGTLIVDDHMLEYRIENCVNCPSFQPERSRCLKCGCFMNIKARLVTSKCPIGKW